MNIDNLQFNSCNKVSSWVPLFRWSAIFSSVMLLFIPIQILIFIISPPPETVKGFFQLYHSNWFLGLLSLDFLYLLNNAILILIYLAIFIRLFDIKPAVSLMALVIGLVGIVCYFPSNISFEMLTLSTKYFNVLPSEQIHFIAAGEALISRYTGTSFDVYYVLNAISLLMFSSAMIKSGVFKKSIGWWGLISGILMIIPSSAGIIGMIFSLLSLIPWVVFLILLTKCFYLLSTSKI